MSAPTATNTNEITTAQSADHFADSVIDSGSREWPAVLEAAMAQCAAAKLTNDPAIVAGFAAITEAADSLAGAGQKLKAALAPHMVATGPVTELGTRAADSTRVYQND